MVGPALLGQREAVVVWDLMALPEPPPPPLIGGAMPRNETELERLIQRRLREDRDTRTIARLDEWTNEAKHLFAEIEGKIDELRMYGSADVQRLHLQQFSLNDMQALMVLVHLWETEHTSLTQILEWWKRAGAASRENSVRELVTWWDRRKVIYRFLSGWKAAAVAILGGLSVSAQVAYDIYSVMHK